MRGLIKASYGLGLKVSTPHLAPNCGMGTQMGVNEIVLANEISFPIFSLPCVPSLYTQWAERFKTCGTRSYSFHTKDAYVDLSHNDFGSDTDLF